MKREGQRPDWECQEFHIRDLTLVEYGARIQQGITLFLARRKIENRGKLGELFPPIKGM